jgi:hypothetical protein
MAATLTLVLSGVLLNVNELLGRDRNVLLTSEELGLARMIRERTPVHALFVTSTRHNDPVSVLSGRRILVGYPGWLWAQGMTYDGLERDRTTILTFGPDAPRLLERYGVDYVVIGEEERRQLGADENAYASRYPCVLRTPNYRVYAVSKLR